MKQNQKRPNGSPRRSVSSPGNGKASPEVENKISKALASDPTILLSVDRLGKLGFPVTVVSEINGHVFIEATSNTGTIMADAYGERYAQAYASLVEQASLRSALERQMTREMLAPEVGK